LSKKAGFGNGPIFGGKLNLGVKSISRPSLTQSEQLVRELISMGATVRNPKIYPSDLADETGGKVTWHRRVSEDELRMEDAIAARLMEKADGYLRFCHKILGAARH